MALRALLERASRGRMVRWYLGCDAFGSSSGSGGRSSSRHRLAASSAEAGELAANHRHHWLAAAVWSTRALRKACERGAHAADITATTFSSGCKVSQANSSCPRQGIYTFTPADERPQQQEDFLDTSCWWRVSEQQERTVARPSACRQTDTGGSKPASWSTYLPRTEEGRSRERRTEDRRTKKSITYTGSMTQCMTYNQPNFASVIQNINRELQEKGELVRQILRSMRVFCVHGGGRPTISKRTSRWLLIILGWSSCALVSITSPVIFCLFQSHWFPLDICKIAQGVGANCHPRDRCLTNVTLTWWLDLYTV